MARKRKIAPSSFEADKSLLESGNFADAEIMCGSRTWRVHKSILCPRSSYFDKAFNGNFEEATTNRLYLNEHDPIEIEWLLYYIYTNKASPDLATLLTDPATVIPTCISIFRLADYVCHDNLTDTAKSILQRHLLSLAAKIQESAKSKGDKSDFSQILSDSFNNQFFRAVEEVYRSGSESYKSIREIMVQFVVCTRFLVLRENRFKSIVFKHHEFSAKVLECLFKEDFKIEETLVVHDTPNTCCACDKEGNVFATTWMEPVCDWSAESKKLKFELWGLCKDCDEAWEVPEVCGFLD